MQYQGGKWRMRKDISNILKMFYNDTPDKFTQYIEPFVGGASVLSEVCKWFPKNIIASDYNEDLIIMWLALKDGWMPPDNYKVDQEYYYSLFDKESSPLRTFILFSCSFGGGWKNTIARANKGFLDPHLYYNREWIVS